MYLPLYVLAVLVDSAYPRCYHAHESWGERRSTVQYHRTSLEVWGPGKGERPESRPRPSSLRPSAVPLEHEVNSRHTGQSLRQNALDARSSMSTLPVRTIRVPSKSLVPLYIGQLLSFPTMNPTISPLRRVSLYYTWRPCLGLHYN